FFFSSRRRHTRFSRDWSSDVCSSDLGRGGIHLLGHATLLRRLLARAAVLRRHLLHLPVCAVRGGPARPAAQRRRRRPAAEADPRHLAEPRGPLQRAARGAARARHGPQGRNELHRRLTWPPAGRSSRTWTRPTAPPWWTWATRPSRAARPAPRRWWNCPPTWRAN